MKKIRRIKSGSICELLGCTNPAEWIVANNESGISISEHVDGRIYIDEKYTEPDPQLILCCAAHADTIAKERSPEYTIICPNCHAYFGVG